MAASQLIFTALENSEFVAEKDHFLKGAIT